MDKESIIQNLKDASCSSLIIEEFFKLEESGKTKEQLRLLNKHKDCLLDALHDNQKKIDTLDFLIFHINQKIKQ